MSRDPSSLSLLKLTFVTMITDAASLGCFHLSWGPGYPNPSERSWPAGSGGCFDVLGMFSDNLAHVSL